MPAQLINNRPSGDGFRCCWCFHVRTGTIILGIWHLILHSMAVALLVSLLFNPEVAGKFSNWTGIVTGSTPSPEQGYSPQFPDISSGPGSSYGFLREACSQDIPVALIITLCTCGITVLLLYGTIKKRPNCLMPFFCLQVFDFVVSALTAIGYFSYMPNVHRWLEEYRDMPLQKELLNMDPRWLCALMLLAFVGCMVIKAYFMGIVWSCYKFLKIQQVARIVENFVDIDGEALLPPDYLMATKMASGGAIFTTPPPPPYSAAISQPNP